MVEDVIHLETELQLLLLEYRETFPDAHIPIPETGIAQQVAPLHSERAGRRLRECGFFESHSGIREAGPFDIRIAGEIPELISAARPNTGVIQVPADGKWSTRLGLIHAGQLPIPECPAYPALALAASPKSCHLCPENFLAGVEL